MKKELRAQLRQLVKGNAHCIGHAIAHGMMANPNFDRREYLGKCKEVFDTFGVKKNYSGQMLKLGNKYGVMAYYILKEAYSESVVSDDETSKASNLLVEILAANTGAQIHPMQTQIATITEEISELLFEIEESR